MEIVESYRAARKSCNLSIARISRPSEYVPGGRLVDVPRPKRLPKTVLSLTEYRTANEPRHGPRRKNHESMSNCYPNFDFDASSTDTVPKVRDRTETKGTFRQAADVSGSE